MMIFLGSLIAAIICIVNISRKSSIGTGSGEWATRILSLVWILGGILFISGFTLYTFYLALLGALGGVSYYSTWGYGWVILLGVLVHGFDVAHL